MKKITLLLTLLLAFVSWNSLNAETGSSTGWYAPGERLDVSTLAEGTDVFIYSMCRVNGTDADYSRFIIGDGGNNTRTFNAKPATLVTNNLAYMWKVRSVESVSRTANVDDGNGGSTSVTYTGIQLTFSRNKGSESTEYYWGIGGLTNNQNPGDAQKFVLTQWTKAPYVNGTSKSGNDVWLEDAEGNIIPQSDLTASDLVYLMCSISGKAINTNNGNYGAANNTNGYPVALYSVREAQAPADPLGFHVSAAPTTTDGATVWNEDTKWYKMKISSSRYVESSGSYTDTSNKLALSQATSSNLLTGAWAVVGNNTNGYQFYNMGEGPSKVLGITGSDGNARTAMVNAAAPGDGVTTTFDITYHIDGNWYIKKHGTGNEYINNRDGYVALWNSSAALGNSGSAFTFEAIDDVSAYAKAAQTKFLNRVGMWKKVPALWADAATAYDALNAITLSETVTNAELVTAAAAQKTAAAAFISAVNNQRVTFSNCSTSPTARVNSFMYYDSGSNKIKGRDAERSTNTNNTLDEVFTLKPGNDITVKIYSATATKYIGTPTGTTSGSTAGVAETNAPGFDIHTADDFADNSVVFCLDGTATMHLLGGLSISGYNSNTDAGSRWLISTDVSRHDLKNAINNATTWKSNLETLVGNLATAQKISVKPISHNVILPPAITKAQTAFDAPSGTQASRTAAATALNAALTKAQGAWLGELGTAQQFRLKNHAITSETTENDVTTTTNYYLTMGQTKNDNNEGNAILAAYNENDVNQIFTLKQGTGSNAGKYILVSNNKQLTDLGGWNTNMTDEGTPYAFEEVDLANSLFRVRTTKGLLGPNSGVTGATASKFIYTNHNDTRGNLTWELEFIAPTLGEVNKTSLQAIYDSQNFVSTKNSLNIINQTAPSLATYKQVRTNAKNVIDGTTGSTITQLDVNTAEAELKAAYSQLLTNFISEADPTQGYRLVYYHATNYTAKDLLLTFKTEPFEETNAVNALQLKQRSAATAQTAQFVSAGSDNSFYIVEGFNKKQVGEGSSNWWNPMLKDNGVAYTIEYATLEGIDGIVARLKNPRGYLGCDVSKDDHPAVAANDHLFNNNSANNYWIIQPCVSPDLVTTLYNKIAEARRYEGHIGTALGQYSTATNQTNEALVSVNDLYTDFINETGSYEGQEKTNAGVSMVLDVYNNTVFPINIIQPEVGKLYRFKGAASNKYMSSTAVTEGNMSLIDANDNTTVFIYSEGGKLLSFGNGNYVNNTHSCSAIGQANGNVITFSSSTNKKGKYRMQSNFTGGGTWVVDYNTRVDRRTSYDPNDCDWTIEEVTSLPININAPYNVGTVYSPVPLQKDETRLKFYTGAVKGSELVLKQYTGEVIPANVPFLVVKQSEEPVVGCMFMEFANTEAELPEGTQNDLQGQAEAFAKGANSYYTLQPAWDETAPNHNSASDVAFRLFTGTNLQGFRAYIPADAVTGESLSIRFEGEDDVTGIENTLTNANGKQEIFDLTGRRVSRATKGLYIINGQKVLVK